MEGTVIKRHKKTKLEKVCDKIEKEIEVLNDQIALKTEFIKLLKREDKA